MGNLVKVFGACLMWSLAYIAQAQEIVSTVRPLTFLVQDLAPKGIDARTILSAHESPHHYSLSISDVRLIKSANLVIWVGPSLEVFLTKPIKRHANPEKILTLQDLFQTEHAGASHDGHHHEADAHIWLSFHNAQLIAQAISQRIVRLYPKYDQEIAIKLADFLHALQEEEKSARKLLGGFGERFFSVYHDGYGHFVEEMGLHQREHVTLVPDEQVSTKRMIQLKSNLVGASCMLVDTNESIKAQKLAERLKLKIVEVDLLGQSVDVNQNAKSEYRFITYMRNISTSFADCLSESASLF